MSPVVPDETPTFDEVTQGLTNQLEFVMTKLKTFQQSKSRRDVINKRLQKVHARRDELRREMYRPCGFFTAATHRSWLLDRRNQELEKLARDRPDKSPGSNSKKVKEDSEKKHHHEIGELGSQQRKHQPFSNLRGSVSREKEEQSHSRQVKPSFGMITKISSPKCKVLKMSGKNGSEKSQSRKKDRIQDKFDDRKARDRSETSWDDDCLLRVTTTSELNKIEKRLLIERETVDKMTHLTASQLAPIMDRTGRLCVDLAPHMAMAGHHAKNRTYFEPLDDDTPHNLYSSGRSHRQYSSRNGYRFTGGHLDTSSDQDQAMNPINVYLNPLSTLTQGTNDRNMLNTIGSSVQFEIPVMLNPGELMATNSRQSSLIGESDVHLQISAHVSLPRKFS